MDELRIIFVGKLFVYFQIKLKENALFALTTGCILLFSWVTELHFIKLKDEKCIKP